MSIKLIAALGNQEPAYTNTRHNVGFAWINQLALAHRGTWQPSKSKEGLVCRLQHNAETVILFKPGKLMNINGKPIAQCARYYKIAPAEVLLCYDDLDLAVGTIKLKQSTGHGGHNGVRNLGQYLDISAIHRLKIGIGRPENKAMVSHYVLNRPSIEEQKKIDLSIAHSIQHIHLLLNNQLMLFQTQLAQQNSDKESEHGI